MAGRFSFGKGGATKAPKEKKPRGQRLAQLRQVYTLAQRGDPRIGLWMALAAAAVLLVGFGIGLAVGHPYYAIFVALPLALFAWRRAWPVSAEERLWAWILFAFGLYRWLEEPGNGQALLWGLTAMTFARAIHAAHRTTAAARPIAPR